MSTSEPLVSILINNYNYARFLHDAIDSALNQTYPNTEVIVVDDGSTDNSREVIAGYGGRIIPVLKENGGQASAFNAGFAASHGGWMLPLDADDIFMTNKASQVVRLARENPAAGLFTHNLEYFGADGASIHLRRHPIRQLTLVDDRRRARRGKLTARLQPTSGLCLRRDVAEKILPMPEDIRITADNYIKSAALALTPVLEIPERLAWQRIHGRNAYTTSYVDPTESALLYRIRVTAEILFLLKREYPVLKKLAWKQYGHHLYQLLSLGSESSRALRREIASRFNVLDLSPVCLFYAGGAFAKDCVRALLHVKRNI